FLRRFARVGFWIRKLAFESSPLGPELFQLALEAALLVSQRCEPIACLCVEPPLLLSRQSRYGLRDLRRRACLTVFGEPCGIVVQVAVEGCHRPIRNQQKAVTCTTQQSAIV